MQNINNKIKRIEEVFNKHSIKSLSMQRYLSEPLYEKYSIDFNAVPNMLDKLAIPSNEFMKLAVISGDNDNYFEHASPMLVKKTDIGNYDIVMLMPDTYYSDLKTVNRLNVIEPYSKDVSPIPKIGGGCLEITFATLKNLKTILTSNGNEIHYKDAGQLTNDINYTTQTLVDYSVSKKYIEKMDPKNHLNRDTNNKFRVEYDVYEKNLVTSKICKKEGKQSRNFLLSILKAFREDFLDQKPSKIEKYANSLQNEILAIKETSKNLQDDVGQENILKSSEPYNKLKILLEAKECIENILSQSFKKVANSNNQDKASDFQNPKTSIKLPKINIKNKVSNLKTPLKPYDLPRSSVPKLPKIR